MPIAPAHAQSGPLDQGGYDSRSDRYRASEPTGNAFDRALRDGSYNSDSGERTIRGRANNDDGLSVRDLSDITAPLAASSGQSLGRDAWHGMDAKRFAQIIGSMRLPLNSISAARLFQRLAATPIPDNDPRSYQGLAALRAEVLYRAGLVHVLAGDKKRRSLDTSGPEGAIVAAVKSKAARALGDRRRSCDLAEDAADIMRVLADQTRRDVLTILMLCALEAGDDNRARRHADDIDRQRLPAAIPLAITRYLVDKRPPSAPIPKRVSLIDFEFLRRARSAVTQRIVDAAEPALVVSLARDRRAPARERLRAIDRAASWGAVSNADRRDILREISQSLDVGPAADLKRVFDTVSSPATRLQSVARMMNQAKPFETCRSVSMSMAEELRAIPPGLVNPPEFSGIMRALISSDSFDAAKAWMKIANTGSGVPASAQIRHWQTLIAIADPSATRVQRDRFRPTQSLAERGQLSPELLHTLVTIMDALGFDIPVGLWEAASRTRQPTDGYLPPTGTLSALQTAVREKRKSVAVMLAISALGPDGPKKTNLLALGDVIRALSALRLDHEARLIALEALWPLWTPSGRQLTRG